MQNYPAARPWKNPPKTGLRAGGKRTGNYGRGWRVVINKDNAKITNGVLYAVYVGGSKKQRPGQARALAARGWQSTDDVIPRVKKQVGLPQFSKVFWQQA